jgi:uncharacterized membrane protein (UPF0127 family)
MSRWVDVVNRKTGLVLLKSSRWCSSFTCRLLGYQFRRRLKSDESLILVHKKESIRNSSIHMFFVFTDLVVIWLDKTGRVTSVQVARPWRPYYASPEPASYVLETSMDGLELFHPGDQIDFFPVTS